MFFSSSCKTASRWAAASLVRFSSASAADAASRAFLRLASFRASPARTLASCRSLPASISRYLRVSARFACSSARRACSASAPARTSGRRPRADPAAARAAASCTRAAVSRLVAPARSARSSACRALAASVRLCSWASWPSSASISAARAAAWRSISAAAAFWRSISAAAASRSVWPWASSSCRVRALWRAWSRSFSSTAMRLSLPLISAVILRISPFRRSISTVRRCACIRISSASCWDVLSWLSQRS